MTIREYLKKLGASDQELSAKVIKRLEEAMLIDTDLSEFKPDAVVSVLNAAASGLSQSSFKAETSIMKADDASRRLNEAIAKSDIQIQTINDLTNGLSKATIEDEGIKDAVMAYAATLRATKEIFGDTINADVMVAAINAGSYIAWRGLMGPKYAQDSENVWEKGGRRR